MAFLQFIGTVALFLGLCFGMTAQHSVSEQIRQPLHLPTRNDMPALAVLAIYLILTSLILMIRSERWGATPTQIRAVWFLAFALSSIGAPLIVWFSGR